MCFRGEGGGVKPAFPFALSFSVFSIHVTLKAVFSDKLLLLICFCKRWVYVSAA